MLTVGVCPFGTITNLLIFSFVILISLLIMVWGYIIRNGLVGFLGGFMMLALSVYLWNCLWIAGVFISFFSLFVMSYFIFKGTVNFR